MKKSLLLLIFFLILTGCIGYGKITIENDAFKNATTISMKYKHSSMESQGTFAGKFITISSYYREIKSGVTQPVHITFKIEAMEDFTSLKSEGFLRVNKKTYPLNLTGITSVLKTDLQTTLTQTENDTITRDHINLKTTTTAQTQTYRWKTMTGTITLPENVEEEILKSTFFAFRIYIDTKALTFIVKRKDLAKLQEFLRADQHYIPN